MFPCFSMNNVGNCNVRYTESGAKRRGSVCSRPPNINGSDQANIVVSQAGFVSTLSTRDKIRMSVHPMRITTEMLILCSALANHVQDIFMMGPRPQVVRVDAGRIVTGVTNTHTIRNGAPMSKGIGESVSKQMTRASVSAHEKPAIAAIISCANPRPALILRPTINTVPKLLHLLWGKMELHRMLLTSGAAPRAVSSAPGLRCVSQLYQITGA